MRRTSNCILAKSSETAEKMLSEVYQTALLQGQKLIFYPMDVENKEAWSIELTEEEARAAQETGEYSILEFQDHAAYVYYDACAVDNASHNNTHSNVAHVNSNTTPSHMNTAGGSVPGTAQIPVPQKPQSNTFMKDLPKTAAAVPFSMKPGTTKKPD